MIENLDPVDELIALALSKSRPDEYRTVPPSAVEELDTQGWNECRKLRRSRRMRRPKLTRFATWHLFSDSNKD